MFCFNFILINFNRLLHARMFHYCIYLEWNHTTHTKKANRKFSPPKFYVCLHENKLSFVICGFVVILQLNSQEKGWEKRKMGGRFLLLRAYWGRQSLRNWTYARVIFFFFDVVHRITMQSQLLWLLTVSVFLLILMSLTAPAARKKTGSSEYDRSMYKNMPGKC